MAIQSDKNRVRVGGSGFTIFAFAGQPIAFCDQVAETSPTPVGPGPVAIHPIDEPYPVQVITPAAAGMGSITLNMYELYNEKVWDRLGSEIRRGNNPYGGVNSNQVATNAGDQRIFAGAVDIVDVFIRQAEYAGYISLFKFIRPPKLGGIAGKPWWEQYHGCVVTNVVDGESIRNDTMEITKQITIGYLFRSRNGKRSDAFAYRDAALPGQNLNSNRL